MDSRSVSAFDFLQRAERYAEARGDDNFFKNFYVNYREYNSVTDSVWKTLSYLYGDDVANMLEFQQPIDNKSKFIYNCFCTD